MKLFFALLLSFLSSFVIAKPIHYHPKAQLEQKQSRAGNYGTCTIKLVNKSLDPIQIFGVFDDDYEVIFYIYPFEPPSFISLAYYGYCHQDMYLSAKAFDESILYSGYPRVGSTLIFSSARVGYKVTIE